MTGDNDRPGCLGLWWLAAMLAGAAGWIALALAIRAIAALAFTTS